MKQRFEPIFDKCAEIVDFIVDDPAVSGLDESVKFKIRLCSEEAVENIVRYAYEAGAGYLEAEVSLEDGYVVVTLQDSGVPFNPLEAPDPDITLSAQDRQVGGLGIFLCKQMMDAVYYSFVHGCNNLTMKLKVK